MTMAANTLNTFKTIYRWIIAFGFDPLRLYNASKGFLTTVSDYLSLKNAKSQTRISFNYPCLHDRFDKSGVASGHYFHQDYYIAKKIFENGPEKHVDVASRIDGFVAHVAVFREIEVFDIRQLNSPLDNLKFKVLDIMKGDASFHDYCDSLSCLHALEHFGLGRYGDSVDIEGHLKGAQNLMKILRPGGTLYVSVPIGKERIEFNAHRVFAIDTILKMFSPVFSLKEFSYVDDQGDFHQNVPTSHRDFSQNMNCHYGCGIFTFVKELK